MDPVKTQPDGTPVEDPALQPSSDQSIEDTIQTHLDAFNALDDSNTPDPVTHPDGEPTTGEPAAPVEPAIGEPASDGDPAAVKPVAPAKPDTGAVAEASTLPAAYRRTAKARGWDDKEIDDFATANPDLALKTFERMHDSRTKEIQEWADLGRKARQTAPAAPAAPAVTAPAVSAASQTTPIDTKAFAELYGVSEEAIQAIMGPINERFAALEPLVQRATAAQAQAEQTQRDSLVRIVQEFFVSPEIAPYKEAYGTDPTALTAEQSRLRDKVVETADALLAGATMQGRELSVPDALALAHDSESSSFKEQIIRDQLRKDTTRREKGITLRPSAKGRKDAGGPPHDRSELLARTEDRLQAVFG